MKRSRPGLLPTIFIFLLATPLLAQVNDTYVIPIVGNTAGAGNTRWATEFHVFNPQGYTLTVTAVFLPSGGGAGKRVDFEVDSNVTAFAENVLEDVFGTSGTGSLLVATLPEENPGVRDDVIFRAFLVNTKTYNNASSGTFGQSVPGVWAGLQDYETDEISAIAHGVRNFGTLGLTGFRTNIGAVNLGDFSVTMRVSVYDDTGRTVANRIPFLLPPQGHIQDRLPVQVDHGSVEFFVDDPRLEAVVFAYATTVDNRSGDGAYVNPILLATPGVVFPKMSSPTEVGKKINTEIARRIAAAAEHLGVITTQSGGRLSRE